MTTHERWNRLADAMTVVCPPDRVTVHERRYPGGVSRSIGHNLLSGYRFEVTDAWWRKNHDIWIGYNAALVNREGIIVRQFPITKKRSEVVAAFVAAAEMSAA